MKQWYALRVKSRCEKAVASVVHLKGYEQFLPLYRSRNRWSDRFKSVELPLFAGYVFCRLDSEHRLPLLTIPGVLHFVGVGKLPAPIDEAEVEAIQTALQSGVLVEPWPFPELGQRVHLASGPMAGFDGILVQAQKQDRIVLSLSVLKRSVAMEIERDWISPNNASRYVASC